MNRLLSLLLSLFGDLSIDRIQAILARVAEQYLPDIAHAKECRTQLLTWLRTGTLDDMIKSDPKAVIICAGYVALGVLAGAHDHDEDPDTPDQPIIIVGAQDQAECAELCSLLGIQEASVLRAVGDSVEEAAIPPAVWLLLVQELVKIIKKAIDEWID